MRKGINENITPIVLTVFLSVIGFMFHENFVEVSLSQLEICKSVTFVNNDLKRSFRISILFSLAIGSIPLFYVVANKLAKLKSFGQKLVVIGTIIGFGVLSWQLRIVFLNKGILRLLGTESIEFLDVSISIQTLKLEAFLWIGFLIGTLTSVLIFRLKNKRINQTNPL